SAVTTALSASGFPAASFTFCGFAPARSAARKAWIAGFRRLAHPLVFFEAPHRLAESLADFLEVLGPRRALAAREMTKLHEEYVFGDLAALAADVSANPRKGEVTLVVEGAPRGQGAAARTEGFFVELGGLEEEGCPGLAADAAPGGDPGAAPGRCPEGQPDGDPGAAPGSGLESQPWGPEGLIEAEPCSVDGGESSGAEGGGRGSPPDAEPPEEGGDRGPLCSPRSVAALKTLFEAARADDRRLSESARELAGLTGIPKKALYALLSHFRSPEG
ncbi:MAG: hypothetical protein LBQ12_13090, partial [Deltaproteobacteria bacterium]|nr:hypothetical protein [Deltaproteobacteria bacterium]